MILLPRRVPSAIDDVCVPPLDSEKSGYPPSLTFQAVTVIALEINDETGGFGGVLRAI